MMAGHFSEGEHLPAAPSSLSPGSSPTIGQGEERRCARGGGGGGCRDAETLEPLLFRLAGSPGPLPPRLARVQRLAAGGASPSRPVAGGGRASGFLSLAFPPDRRARPCGPPQAPASRRARHGANRAFGGDGPRQPPRRE
ncbi:hypothetical protein GGTG_11577 [Gaeumannomyces tritici R3-111a-1]|uniref:Uncharacterized protein n=1 Tax=Gaeumannomyces tritici (strain R3-111a-1) TaxID=644352 RepID=J3PDK4_GAET3|nr:hypothetical protein GGTG_11577 [Gaeumannomyces tritici R3-111a-1]EJT70554.1 hypothetical protein GGTG_11577 [Gaeumannomyces tritici R3-111a-1]